MKAYNENEAEFAKELIQKSLKPIPVTNFSDKVLNQILNEKVPDNKYKSSLILSWLFAAMAIFLIPLMFFYLSNINYVNMQLMSNLIKEIDLKLFNHIFIIVCALCALILINSLLNLTLFPNAAIKKSALHIPF